MLEIPHDSLRLKEEDESDADHGPEAGPHQAYGSFFSEEVLKDLPISLWVS